MMKLMKKIFIAFGLVLAFFLGTRFVASASSLYQVIFTHITQAQSYSVGVASSTVVSDTNIYNRTYLSLDNSGSVGVSCYPVAPSSTYAYGGGWWLAPNGGAITFDGPAMWGGQVICLTGSGTTTLAVTED